MSSAARTGVMRVVCAWCDAGLGTQACVPEMDGKVSHGICEQCMAKQLAQDVTADSFAPVDPVVPEASAARPNFDAGTARPSGEHSRGAPAQAAAASTPTAAAAGVDTRPVYVALAYIAEACGVSEYQLHNTYRPPHWGIPRDWQWVKGITLYNEAALPELADSLAEAGQAVAAAKLRAWWMARSPAPAPAPRTEKLPWFKEGQFE